jgi:hypothetical protein
MIRCLEMNVLLLHVSLRGTMFRSRCLAMGTQVTIRCELLRHTCLNTQDFLLQGCLLKEWRNPKNGLEKRTIPHVGLKHEMLRLKCENEQAAFHCPDNSSSHPDVITVLTSATGFAYTYDVQHVTGHTSQLPMLYILRLKQGLNPKSPCKYCGSTW